VQYDWLYILSDREFYEDLSRFPTTPAFSDVVQSLLPAGWATSRTSVWLHAGYAAADTPAQGFKIHVSSINAHAIDVLKVVVPECVTRGIPFKLAADPNLLGVLNSKGYDRGGSGKFMTIYPPTELAFIELIGALHERTKAAPFVGPYILSDRRYQGSKILFYRYGGFRPLQSLRIDGSREQWLVGPDGTKVRDVRLPYFNPPPWVQDPFGDPDTASSSPSLVLGDRFEVQSVITFSNRGGVYTALDRETSAVVVIKEARPHVNRMRSDGRSVDGTDFLSNEYRILSMLAPLGNTPAPVALFWEWEHLFMAQEKIEGVGLKRFMAQTDNIMLPYIHYDGVLAAFLPKFRHIALCLLDAVEAIHRRGVVLGDLSLTNVIVDPSTLNVRLIDVESAVSQESTGELHFFSYNWYTPGFQRPGRGGVGQLTVADDHYAVGMILYNMLVAGIEFIHLKPEAQSLFLDRLVELGVPLPVRHAIDALLDGDVSTAVSELRQLPVT
jgi:protein kinase-like protein